MKEEFSFIYKPQKIHMKGLIGKGGFWTKGKVIFLIVISIILIISLTFFGCHFFRKSKKIEQKLKYEMTDVRNIANKDIIPQSEIFNYN